MFVNQNDDENAPIKFSPNVRLSDSEPQIKSIYYPSKRYGGTTKRSRLEVFVKEIKETIVDTKLSPNEVKPK